MSVCVYSIWPLFKNLYLVCLTCHLSSPAAAGSTHFIVHANTIVLFEKNGGSGRSPVKPWSVSKKELSHFLWGGKPARMAQWLQGWNNKQGQLDYSLWSKVTYCIWNMYCSVNSFFQSLMFHYKNKLSIVLRGSARMLFWETTPCSSK